jgi:hypothetical protein
MTSVLATGTHNLLEQVPSSSMTTIDNRVGEGQGGVAATYCIKLSCHVPVNSNEDATVSRAYLTQ